MSACECSDGRRGSLRPMSVNSAVSCSRDLRARLDGETCLLIQYSILRAFFSFSFLNPYFSLSRLQLTFACLRRCGEHRRATMCLSGTSASECSDGRRRSRRRLMSVGSAVSGCFAALFSYPLYTFIFPCFSIFSKSLSLCSTGTLAIFAYVAIRQSYGFRIVTPFFLNPLYRSIAFFVTSRISKSNI